jgi:uncharacterized protein YdaU (DUF1376 family)
MSRAPWMPVFTDALLGDTSHLSAEEFGAYCLILFATWNNGGRPFDDDDHRMARIIRSTPKRWQKLRPVLTQFFDLSDRKWAQKRLQKEYARIELSLSQKSLAGKASALKRQQTTPTAVEGPLPSRSQRLANTPTNNLDLYLQKEKPILSDGQKESRSRRQQIPPDWLPSEAGYAYALDKRHWSHAQADENASHFRDHHRSKGNLFSDCDAAWRTWVRNSAKFSSNGNGQAPQPYDPIIGNALNPPLRQRQGETITEFHERRDKDAQMRTDFPYAIRAS